MSVSEVATLRQRLQVGREAAQRVLYSFASGISRHDFIEKRM